MMKYKKEVKKEVVNALKVVFLISVFICQSAISKEALPELEIKKSKRVFIFIPLMKTMASGVLLRPMV